MVVYIIVRSMSSYTHPEGAIMDSLGMAIMVWHGDSRLPDHVLRFVNIRDTARHIVVSCLEHELWHNPEARVLIQVGSYQLDATGLTRDHFFHLRDMLAKEVSRQTFTPVNAWAVVIALDAISSLHEIRSAV